MLRDPANVAFYGASCASCAGGRPAEGNAPNLNKSPAGRPILEEPGTTPGLNCYAFPESPRPGHTQTHSRKP